MERAEKILIVEDEAIIASIISRSLKYHGYSVTVTRKGKDALEKIQISNYNLILLDIGLPDISGIELLKKIRETDDEIIIILITGRPCLETSVDSVNNGADGYLIKPLRENELIDIIEGKLIQRFKRKINSSFN